MTICNRYSPRILYLVTVAIGGSFAFASEHDTEEKRPAWNDINVIRENVELPRAHFIPHRNVESGSSVVSLNGTWKFNYADSPSGRPADFYQQDYDVTAWDDTPVPSNWEREGYGHAIYVNVPYAFETDEPNVPT